MGKYQHCLFLSLDAVKEARDALLGAACVCDKESPATAEKLRGWAADLIKQIDYSEGKKRVWYDYMAEKGRR